MEKNMTSGTPWKLVLGFSLPIMGGNLLQQLYTTMDSVIVGQFVSSDALGATGTCFPLTVLLLAFAIGLSTGASILVSQLYGAGKQKEMRRAEGTSLLLLTLFGVVMSVLGVLFSKALLKYVLGVPDSVLGMAALYMRIYSVGLIFQFVYNIVAAILRSIGDSRATLYFLLVSSVLNIVLDLVFILCFGWGIAGAAAATVIAQAASCIVSVIYMFRKHEVLRLQRSELVLDRGYCGTVLKLGIPVALQQCMMSVGQLAVQRLVNSYGTAMMSAYTSASRLESYVMAVITSLNAGMSVFVGQNIGAGKPERVRKALRQCVVVSFFMCLCLSSVVFFLGGQIVRIFGITGEVLEYAGQFTRGEAPFYLIFAVYQVAAALLQGSGDVTFATCCTVESLILRIAASWILALFTPLSYAAIWWAMPIAWFAGLFPAYIRYLRGTWLKKALVD